MMRASSFAVKPSLQPVALAVALLLAPAGAALAQDIGRVQQTQGLVTLLRGASSQVVENGTALQAGDVVETQSGSAVALRYVDGTEVQLGAGSRFTVSQFSRQPERVQEENFTAQLLRGAMRVVTGSIAQRCPENFRISTSTATIGIRGTDFSVRLCEDDCRVSDGPQVASARLPELAGRVGAVSGTVWAIDERGLQRGLNASSAVRSGDLLITGDAGVAVVVLTDGTRIALDPNSRFWIAAYEFDSARPEAGRIALELIEGAAQLSSGQVAKLRPERFAFAAGDQFVRVHGTVWGAVIPPPPPPPPPSPEELARLAREAAQRATEEAARKAQEDAARAVEAARAAGGQASNATRALATQGQQGVAAATTQANQMATQAGNVASNQVQQTTQQAQQGGQQAQQQITQGVQTVLAALPPAPPPVSQPSGPPGPGYDITGGKVGSPSGMDTITQGTFNTVITGQTWHMIDTTWMAINTTETVVPPMQVRTAGGMLLTGGTILRHIERNVITGQEATYITFVGMTFAASPSPAGQAPRPGGVLLSACASCTGLVASDWEVVPSKIEEARLRQEANAAQAARNPTRGGGGSGMPVAVCTENNQQCEELRQARAAEQARNAQSRGSSGSTGSPAPAPAPSPAPAPAPASSSAPPPPPPNPPPAPSNSTVSVAEGAVTSTQRGASSGSLIAAGQLLSRYGIAPINPSTAPAAPVAAATNPSAPAVRAGRLPFVAPNLSASNMTVDMTRLFGADVIPAQGTAPPAASGFAPAGVYVHVQDGAVSLVQGGQEVVIGRGETATAPSGGGAPARVMRGVRVLNAAVADAMRIASQGQCHADLAASTPPVMSAKMIGLGSQVTFANDDLRDMRWQGELTDKITEKDIGGRGGRDQTTTGFGNRNNRDLGNNPMQTAFNQAKGDGIRGGGRLHGPTNIVGGRHRDTFRGDQINNASGQDITLGGKPGRVGNIGGSGGKVSSGVPGDAADVKAAEDAYNKDIEGAIGEMMKMEGIPSTGNLANDVAELGYALSVGRDTYAATKNMSSAERKSYLDGQANAQRAGNSRPREDDCSSCGGNPIPIFITPGQFGNDMAAMGRAIIAEVQKAGGTGDGRGDKDSSSGGSSGVMMSRLVQLGGLLAAAGGALNVDEALKINRLVQPGAQ